MSTTDDDDGENIFARNGSSSENEIVESRQLTRNPGRELARNPLRQLSINNGLSKYSKQSLFLGNSRKPSYGSSASNSSEKIKSLPLPPSKAELENLPLTKNNAELENSPRIKRKSSFLKNLISKNRKLFNNGERDGNIGRMDSSSLPTGSGSQMLTNNNSKTYKNGADSNQIGEIFPYESDEESDSTILDVAEMTFNGEGSLDNHLNNKIHSVAKSRTSPKASNLSDQASTVDKKSSLNIQEKVVLEKDQKDFESDVTRKRTFIDAILPYDQENKSPTNHMKIKIPAVDVEKKPYFNVHEKLVLDKDVETDVTRERKTNPWDQVSFLAEGENVFIRVDDLIQISGMPDLIPDINHLDLSGKISDHFKFSGWIISHLSLKAACRVPTPAKSRRTPQKMMLNQLQEGVSQVKVERMDMKSLDPNKNVNPYKLTQPCRKVTPRNHRLEMDVGDRNERLEIDMGDINEMLEMGECGRNKGLEMDVGIRSEMLEMSKLSTLEFGELFGLRLKTSAEMKKGVVGHKSRRLRKPKTKYSP